MVGSPWSCPGKEDGDFYAENLVPVPLDLDACIWNLYLAASRYLLDGVSNCGILYYLRLHFIACSIRWCLWSLNPMDFDGFRHGSNHSAWTWTAGSEECLGQPDLVLGKGVKGEEFFGGVFFFSGEPFCKYLGWKLVKLWISVELWAFDYSFWMILHINSQNPLEMQMSMLPWRPVCWSMISP